MLERILIRNFQKHQKLRIDIDPRVTTLIGPTDAGKSAALRAIRWVCQNVPAGDAHVRVGAKGTTVAIILDGRKVTRRRGAGTNSYALDDQEYKSFGNGVPDPVNDVLGVSDVNFQNQHDLHFWFSLTAGEVSRQLNSVVDLGVIDDAMARIASRVRQITAEESVTRDRLKEAEERLEEKSWVPRAAAAHRSLLASGENHANIAANASAVGQLVSDGRKHTAARGRALGVASGVRGVLVLGKRAGIARKRCDRLADLSLLCGEYMGVAECRPDISVLVDAYTKMRDTNAKRDVFEGLYDEAVRLTDDSDLAKTKQKTVCAALHVALDGSCPICGGEFDDAETAEMPEMSEGL